MKKIFKKILFAVMTIATIGTLSSCNDEDSSEEKGSSLKEIMTFKNLDYLRNLSTADAIKVIEDIGYQYDKEAGEYGDIMYRKKYSDYETMVELTSDGCEFSVFYDKPQQVSDLTARKLEEEHSFSATEPLYCEVYYRGGGTNRISDRQKATDLFLQHGDDDRQITFYYENYKITIETERCICGYGIFRLKK